MPDTYNADVVDHVLTCSDQQAAQGARLLAQRYGLLVGISSGAAFAIAHELSKKQENKGKTIVALLPDTGERYLTTGLFC